MQVCTWLQTDNHASTPPLCFFTGRMPFLPPNQQCRGTEGIKQNILIYKNHKSVCRRESWKHGGGCSWEQSCTRSSAIAEGPCNRGMVKRVAGLLCGIVGVICSATVREQRRGTDRRRTIICQKQTQDQCHSMYRAGTVCPVKVCT